MISLENFWLLLRVSRGRDLQAIYMYICMYIYIYIYIYILSKTSLSQVLKPFISDKIKLLRKLYFNVSGRCPFVKNKNYKIEDAPYIHSIT